MSERAAQLLEFLQKGGDLKTLLAEQTPAAVNETLDRAAIARAFDEAIYRDVLRAGVAEPPDFAIVKAHADIEPLGGESGWFRVRDAVAAQRAEAFRRRAPHQQWLDLETGLAAAFERRGEGWRHFRLHHLIAADPKAAAALFDDLFGAADATFDLARCEDVLRTVNQRRAALSQGPTPARAPADFAELDEHVIRARCRFNGRVLTTDDWYRSLRYFERVALQKHLEALLKRGDHKPWIVQLHAPGGRGKTMLLRWFAARRCVPADVAVARLDFDLLGVQPDAWVLLLRIAEQLHSQIPQSELDSVLRKAADAIHATGQAQQTTAADTTAAEANVAEADRAARRVAQHGFRARLGLDLPKAIGVALRESVGDQPIVIVIDTFEEAILRHLADLPELVNAIARLHAECPSVRLVLAGRYDLVESDPTLWRALRVGDERDADVEKRFRRAFSSVPVGDFTDAESRSYLVLRGLGNDPRLKAAVECGRNLPLRLALVADLLQSGTQLSEDELRRAGDFDLVYLVERVVARIGSPTVQWLLGYGVVPRRLTFEIFREVLAPELADAMRGAAAGREGGEAAALPSASGESAATGGHLALPPKLPHWADLLPTDIDPPRTDAELRAAWDDLCRYASSSSWVFRSKVDPQALEFHEDVRVPLTGLLAKYPVSRRLHARAAAYFAAQAAMPEIAADATRWAGVVCDELFHRFAGGETDATDRWRTRLQEAVPRNDHRATMAIAELVLAKGFPGVDDSIRAMAWHSQAVAAFDIAEADPAARRRRVEQAMNELDRLPQTVVDAVVPKGERALFRAQIAFFNGDAARALAATDDAVAALSDGPRRVDALALAALVRMALGRDDALPFATQAIELERRLTPQATPREAMLARQVADTALVDGDHALALDVLRSTRERLATGDDPTLPAFLSFTEANIAVRAGRAFEAWHEVEGSLDAVSMPAGASAGRVGRIMALESAATIGPALLGAIAPAQAIELGETVLAALADAGPTDDPHARQLELQIRLTTGIAHRTRWAPNQATPVLAGVFEQAYALGDMSLASQAVIALAELDLVVTGNLRTMESWLATGNRLELPERTEQLHRLAGLHAMFLGRRGAGGEVAAVVDSMRRTIVGAPPQAGAAFFAAALVAEEDVARRERAADDLLDILARIDSPAARTTILGKLPLADALPPRPERTRRVGELLPLQTGTGDGQPPFGLTAGDAVIYDLAALEAHRVMGDAFAAAIVVRRAWSNVVAAPRAEGMPAGGAAVLRVLEAATRLGVRLDLPAAMFTIAAAAEPLAPGAEGIVAALRVAIAENVLGADGPATVDLAWLAEVEPLLHVAGLERSLLARRLHVVRAVVHRAAGDLRAAENDFGAADALASECGDERDRRRIATLRSAPVDDSTRWAVTAKPPPAPSPPVDSDASGEARAAAALDAAPRLWLRASLTTAKAVEVRTLRASSTGGERPLVSVHWALREVARGDVYAERLVEALTVDCKKVAAELRAILVDRDADRVLRGLRGDPATPVRLELDGSELLPIPWEYAIAGPAHGGLLGWFFSKGEPAGVYRAIDAASSTHHRIVWLQEALNALGSRLKVDGFLGPATASAFAATVRKLGGEATKGAAGDSAPSDRTLIERALITAAPRRQVVAIGAGNPVTDAVDTSYRSELLFSHLEPAPAKALGPEVAQLAPAVLFLRASVRESSAFGRLALDFSPPDDTERHAAMNAMKQAPRRRGVEMSIADLDELLCMMPIGRRPLVVLDVPSPRNDSTRIRRMLARNAFAGELFLRNHVPAVLAMGGLGQRLSHLALKNSLRLGAPIGRAVQALRGAMIPASPLLGPSISHADCVLYCHDPMWRPVLDPEGFEGRERGA